MITIALTQLNQIKAHASATYPEECCGVLFGEEGESGKIVREILDIPNAKEENRERRFLITPEEYRRSEQEAERLGLEVLGFYHSHPDHPARPSQFDLEHAMPWWSYVIVSVKKGMPADVTSWSLDDDRREFREEKIAVDEREARRVMPGVGSGGML
ncbi:MAG: M67 family metallopeptidase [Ignavibacteriales bacterium]|nr:M67 family metallopeptidase [Ignavibacteriales bacterium]